MRPHSMLLLSLLLVPGFIMADELQPLNRIRGICTDARLATLVPTDGLVRDQATLESIWKGWSVAATQPTVDFQNQLVLIETVTGPNRALARLELDAQGNLSYKVASTRMAGPGFGYLILVIPNRGIKSINGKAIAAAPEPAANPADSIPDSIRVQVVGLVETGVMAIGGETTGTTIASSGVVWELDFQSASQLKFARQAGQRKVVVMGTLILLEGTERKRTVIDVEAINWASAGPRTAPANRPANDRNSDIVRQAGPRPTTGEASNDPRLASNRPSDTTPQIDPTELNGFKKIVITMSGPLVQGEQVRTVTADGEVSIDSGGQRNSAQLPLEKLALIHRHIGSTDWRSVPRATQATNENAFKYTVEIYTDNGINRLATNSDAVVNQKEQAAVRTLFLLLKGR